MNPTHRDDRPVVPRVRRPRPEPDAAARAHPAACTKRLVRAVLVGIAVILTGVFAVAFWLNPYDADGQPRRMATHTQLGMPPCNFVALTGKPCPSCGMTTSFALLVRGDVSASLKANWVGSILCVLWAVALVWAIASAVWGKMLGIAPGYAEMVFTILVGGVLVLMISRWVVVLLQD
ncbi:MAG: DUF2752 domain-containing protein [Gemmataceae bacterium]|nr:DUF2752 domain-containing protein [Gemmata sp.]MDW8198820.1 DUF2752 domain-containing protein [Gemmataceae bacterium]